MRQVAGDSCRERAERRRRLAGNRRWSAELRRSLGLGAKGALSAAISRGLKSSAVGADFNGHNMTLPLCWQCHRQSLK